MDLFNSLDATRVTYAKFEKRNKTTDTTDVEYEKLRQLLAYEDVNIEKKNISLIFHLILTIFCRITGSEALAIQSVYPAWLSNLPIDENVRGKHVLVDQ